ncbi:activating signal cointegrator 1 complex subunit 2 [Chrysoperla carnea]|uniref:activating signal cointegrator 1 complex subunit 2 n=1 Tax=Chrysoperla carnea TaxID=189513 RepID=UPI001D07C62D|nr:activating signal cointegrator 1 complex subunit 2 [Chrysoperla carnea]
MYNIQQDNGRLIKAFYEISETDRKLLNDFLKNAEILQKNYADGEKFHEINVENFNLTPKDMIDSYGPNYKLDLTKAITKQMKIDEMKNESLASNGEDEPNEEDFNKSTEQCLSKGLIRAVNDYKCDFNYQLHVGLDFKPKIHLDSDETQEDKQERLRKLDAKVEKIYQRYMERKRKKSLEKSTSHEDNHDTTSSIANGNIDNGLSSYNDEDADMKRALAESLKETATVKDDLPDTDDVVFQSLISQVKDILPHLGEGYIKECLKHFNNNSEETISAILEQRLPPELTSIDENLPIIPADTEKPKRNVFEGDEFDRMTKSDFDPTRIFRKKNKVGYRNAMDMLNDKTHIKKEVYEQYSLDYYDDDYDDDVKEIDLGEREVEEVDDIEQIRCPINQPIEEDEDSSEEDDETPKPPSNAFCEDPAVLRARAEERRRQKYQKKGFQKPTQESRGDVVGNPKGQGQEKNVVISRAKKDQNKSQRANHNRRSGAQWKRSRGMIPS